MNKGQLISADFTPSLFLFLGILVGMLVTWDSVVSQIEDVNTRNDMERAALLASDSLVRGTGRPSNWSSSNVVVIGLSDGTPNVLNPDKAAALLTVNYNTSKELLGVPYDFYIELNRTSGSVFTVGGNQTLYGSPPTNATNIIIVKRMIIMSGQTGTLTLKVWS